MMYAPVRWSVCTPERSTAVSARSSAAAGKWWRRGELACGRLLITGRLLILNKAVNAKNAVFASPIHVEFTLQHKARSPRSESERARCAHASLLKVRVIVGEVRLVPKSSESPPVNAIIPTVLPTFTWPELLAEFIGSHPPFINSAIWASIVLPAQ